MKPDERLAELGARERVAAAPRHWVSLGTACNNRCTFCLDGDRGRDGLVSPQAIRDDLARGRARGAERVVLSGGEASVHPAFVELIRYARGLGYTWVQTISNGLRFADAAFLSACVEAGLDEVTFSVHGHTPALHDRLTGHPGAFRAVVAAIARAVRSRRLIVSVDVLLCRQNISVLDRIVELCLGLGVREFDLLQVIPQGRAFENRDEMLYEPAEHMATLRRVLRLSRHPDLTVWTNRLPARYLEGFEELIQDPHKLHDEVRGRENELRAWLDDGLAMPCRQPERCRACFLQPFCAWVDDLVARLRESRYVVLAVGRALPSWMQGKSELPFGCSRLEVVAEDPAEWWRSRPSGASGLILRFDGAVDPRMLGTPALPVALGLRSGGQLEAWLAAGELPTGVELEIELSGETAAWIVGHRKEVERQMSSVRLCQPGLERVGAGLAIPPDPRRILEALDLPVRVRGLPRCMLGGARPDERPATLDAALFDPASGRLEPGPLVTAFIRDGYAVKSLRCAECRWTSTCPGLQVNLARVLGLACLSPVAGQAADLALDPATLPGGGIAWDPSRPAASAPRAWDA